MPKPTNVRAILDLQRKDSLARGITNFLTLVVVAAFVAICGYGVYVGATAIS